MADYDRRDQLKEIHASRKAATYQKVDEAIQRLVRANGSINFNSVASEAGVAKATLYNNQNCVIRLKPCGNNKHKLLHRNKSNGR